MNYVYGNENIWRLSIAFPEAVWILAMVLTDSAAIFGGQAQRILLSDFVGKSKLFCQ